MIDSKISETLTFLVLFLYYIKVKNHEILNSHFMCIFSFLHTVKRKYLQVTYTVKPHILDQENFGNHNVMLELSNRTE